MNENEESPNQQESITLKVKTDATFHKSDDSQKASRIDFSTSDTMYDLKEELLNHVASSKAIFKSQQKGDPELTFEENHTIAKNLLEKSRCLFLSKFGHYLKEEHLKYFSNNEDYETVYHINRLRRYFNNSTRHIDVRNRRYEALKILIEKGEYFSESEMMKRNPLLYEHLIGQYLTEEEKKTRDNIVNTANYVDILMETIEKNRLQEHLKSQQEEEDDVREENDSDNDSDNDGINITCKTVSSSRETHFQWGGYLDKMINNDKDNDKKFQSNKAQHNISSTEMQLFRQEFLTNMYQNFLDGKDKDFDYSTVDENEAYDNVELRNQDEEEKYFDSESPETVLSHKECNDESESEDELDAYMKTLKEQTPTNLQSLDNHT